MTDRNRGRIARRELGRMGLGYVLVIGGAGIGVRAARAEEEALVNEVADNAALVKAVTYVNQSVGERVGSRRSELRQPCSLPGRLRTEGKVCAFPEGRRSLEGPLRVLVEEEQVNDWFGSRRSCSAIGGGASVRIATLEVEPPCRKDPKPTV